MRISSKRKQTHVLDFTTPKKEKESLKHMQWTVKGTCSAGKMKRIVVDYFYSQKEIKYCMKVVCSFHVFRRHLEVFAEDIFRPFYAQWITTSVACVCETQFIIFSHDEFIKINIRSRPLDRHFFRHKLILPSCEPFRNANGEKLFRGYLKCHFYALIWLI